MASHKKSSSPELTKVKEEEEGSNCNDTASD
jgi:hypothetical protein